MTVSLVAIEANGWVLAVTGAWSASTYASFALDPEGAPKVVLAVTGAGFDRSGGQAVAAGARPRADMLATTPLRQPFPGTGLPPAPFVLDEVDLGGGQRRVRLALSRMVYAGDAVSVTFAAGWRSGLPGQSLSVTNNSTYAVPLPSFRWASVQYERQTAAFRIDLLVAHGEAEGRDAIAAVKFVGYDGTNTHVQWATAASTSTRHGDNLKCWGVSFNPTGLTAGLISVHAEVYPWIGAMRRTGTAHETDVLRGMSADAMVPLHVAWDPAGTRYPEAHVFVSASSGSTTASAVTVGANLAAAKAGTAALDWATACQAIYLANRTIAAANGRAAITRAADNAVITLAAGTAVSGSTTITSGLQAQECRAIVQGDPDNGNPKANCIYSTSAGPSSLRVNRWQFRNMSVEMGTANIPAGPLYIWFDNVELRGKVGSETSNQGLITSSLGSANLSHAFTRCKWWKFGSGISGTTRRAVLIRNCEVARSFEAPVVVTSQSLVLTDTSLTGTESVGFIGGISVPTAQNMTEDVFLWGNRGFGIRDKGIGFSFWGAATAAEHGRAVRNNWVNNIVERVSAGGFTSNFTSVGESAWTEAVDCVVEGNSLIGQRFNFGYSDPPDNTDTNRNTGNVVRNNYFDWFPTKHDTFASSRGASGVQIGSWSVLYGVGFAANVLGNRHETAPGFPYDFNGVGVAVSSAPGVKDNAWSKFTTDLSSYSGGTTTGGGDYRPGIGAAHSGRGRRAVIDVDSLGGARAAVFSAGAVEAVPPPSAMLAPGMSRHRLRGVTIMLRAMAQVRGAAVRHPIRGDSPLLRLMLRLGAAAARQGMRAAVGGLLSSGGAEAFPSGRVLRLRPDSRTLQVEAD